MEQEKVREWIDKALEFQNKNMILSRLSGFIIISICSDSILLDNYGFFEILDALGRDVTSASIMDNSTIHLSFYYCNTRFTTCFFTNDEGYDRAKKIYESLKKEEEE